ncbi:MAG: TonB family protein [Gammaproteobacteria bacterium]|nr:TonB family protein [Gammaproteobacteria bacterium]
MRRFLLISVCLHAVAALLLLRVDANRDDVLRAGQTIELTLQAFSEPVQQTAAAQDIAPERMAPTPAAHQHKPSAPEQHLASTNRDAPPAALTDTLTVDAQAQERAAMKTLRNALVSALQARFRYPRRAQKRGWEGTVVISLRILPEGQLADVHVANSSGVPVLDRAALRSLSEVSVSRHVAWLDGREIDMLIPVEYRLTDS